MRYPILAEKKYKEGIHRVTLYATGGLHYIKGNLKPYFSLTGTEYVNGHDVSGGAIHDVLLKHFPQFADLAALHMSDIDGIPLYAVSNGFYKLAGYFPDAFGERYHAGNADYHFPITPPADKPWRNTEYRKPTGDECLQFFADHCRIPLAEARTIAEDVQQTVLASRRHSRNSVAKTRLAEIIETMKPRWKAEADACIAKHKLVVFGDKW